MAVHSKTHLRIYSSTTLCYGKTLELHYYNSYRIRANKPPLLIKLPPIQNSTKALLFGAFLGANFGKISINLHLKNLIFLQAASGLLTRIRQVVICTFQLFHSFILFYIVNIFQKDLLQTLEHPMLKNVNLKIIIILLTFGRREQGLFHFQ